MNSVVQKFRGALNGFNRRDVMEYMENMAAAHRKELTDLRRELEESEKERQVLESTLSSLEDAKGTVAAEEDRVRSALEQSTEELTQLRGEMTRMEAELTAANGELEQLRSRVEELIPMAERYNELKDRVATVELDAHRKAQATVDEAKAQAEEIRNRTAAWMDGVIEQYGHIRQTADNLFRGAEEMARLQSELARADEQMVQFRTQK